MVLLKTCVICFICNSRYLIICHYILFIIFQIIVSIDHFKDPDIESLDEAKAVMDHYEWAVADNSINTKLLTKWKTADNVNSLIDKV